MIGRMLSVAGCVSVLAGALPAQTPQVAPGPTLSLADAIRVARENNPTYRQTLNDRAPAGWAVRSAYAQFLPSAGVGGGLQYRGAGSQTFLATTFEQSSSTVSSDYSIGFEWTMSGAKLTEPGLRKAERSAVEADIASANLTLETGITQQYLTVLEARAQQRLAALQVTRNEEFLRLAQARFDVGQATLIDVRLAQVAKGQADVGLLRTQVATETALLRLYQAMGVLPPENLIQVSLTDSFPVRPPEWTQDRLLALAEEANPSLVSLRRRSDASAWAERSARSQYLPSLSFSAGWSGFTQEFTNVDPIVNGAVTQAQADALVNLESCNYLNDLNARVTPPLSPFNCSVYEFTSADQAVLEQQIRRSNEQFPLDFTRQPFSARLTISLPLFTGFSRTLGVSQARAQREDAALALQSQALEVRTEVAQRFLEIQTAYRAIGIQDTNLVAAAEQLQLATERYRVGSGTFFELLDAQLAALRAEADYINAVYAYHRALTALEAAVGRPLR